MGEQVATAGEFAVTEAAARKVAELIEADGRDGIRLRVQVLGGGCSGFQYDFRFDEEQAEDDLIFERDGVQVLVDPVSIEYLQGSEFDYVEEMIGSSFQVKNPNATASCGCGTSFSVM
jgi:iron-sulfur cluster insertion protein